MPKEAVVPKKLKPQISRISQKIIKDSLTKKTNAKPKPKQQQQPDKDLNADLKPEQKQEKIEIPPELPKEKETLYLSYYQTIRNKIRKYVTKNYPHYIARGEICLYFVLTSNGQLEQIKIIEERSTQNNLLKEISKRSVKAATPFLAFPKGLDQPKLSFNVIISFESED